MGMLMGVSCVRLKLYISFYFTNETKGTIKIYNSKNKLGNDGNQIRICFSFIVFSLRIIEVATEWIIIRNLFSFN